MKKRSLFGFVFGLVISLVLISPKLVQAAKEKASSLEELALIVRQHCLDRDSKLEVKYTGSESDLEYLDEEFFGFFESYVGLADDPSTSDDADYIVGNLDFTKEDYYLTIDDDVITFKFKYFETLEETEYVNKMIPKILEELGVSGMSNYEKVKTIHDYVCGLITYKDSKNTASVSTAYAAIKNGKALCNAYSLVMYKLLVEAGVPCKFIGGVMGTGRDSGGHAWNIVALGDKWYHIDVTNDDNDKNNNKLYYDYFLKGSKDYDEVDPDEKHTMNKAYRTGIFAENFPIAKYAFDPDTMNDENKTVKIGDSSLKITPDSGSDKEKKEDTDKTKEKYKLKDIIDDKYPENGVISVKKGKTEDIMLFIREGMEDVIKSVKYKITSGKNRITKVYNYGILEDEEYGAFTALDFKGKAKGKAAIDIILVLKNGQKLTCSFTVKVK